jgi:hypothetical protein
MNKHLPYREWIFEEEPLPEDAGRQLRLHLQQCAECQAVAEGWDVAKQCLRSAGMKSPREGFPSRWKALARERLQTPGPRQAWMLLAASGVGSLAMAMALAVQTSAQGFSLAGVFTKDMAAAVGILKEWSDTSHAIGGFLSIVSRSIPPAVYLFAVFLLSLLGVLGLLMFVRTNSRGGKR